MDKQNRKAIIAGNWKMNKTATEAKALISELIPAVKDAGCEVVICVPFTDLVTAVEMTKGTNIHVGAENVHFEKSGAFTGEISADMLTDLGVEYVVIGHSERRQYFAETNETVNKRTKAALAGGLKPIICVGESLDQREQGVTEELVRMQVKIALNGVTADELKNVVIAYEPIWAIGTGKTATADQAEEVCAAIRKVVGELYGEDAAKGLTVQYGGSMNPKNAEELLGKERVSTSYAWKTMLDKGIHVSGSSDAPVESFDPILAIHCAVTSQNLDGQPAGGWLPQQKLTVQEAVALYTTGSAYTSYEENVKGKLCPGYLADFIVLSQDIFSVPENEIVNTKVEQTYLGGKLVYSR